MYWQPEQRLTGKGVVTVRCKAVAHPQQGASSRETPHSSGEMLKYHRQGYSVTSSVGDF